MSTEDKAADVATLIRVIREQQQEIDRLRNVVEYYTKKNSEGRA